MPIVDTTEQVPVSFIGNLARSVSSYRGKNLWSVRSP